MFTVEKIHAGHMYSEHHYTQWCILDARGYALPLMQKVKRYDSEFAAQSACDKLNKKL